MNNNVAVSRRNLIQHFLLLISLSSLLLFISDSLSVFTSWLDYHKWFLLGWMSLSALIGFYSLTIARKHMLTAVILFLFTFNKKNISSYYRKTLVKKKTSLLRLFIRMSSCPKCVSWWLALVMSFLYHLFYWKAWYASIYFAIFGAAIASFVSVLVYLLKYETGDELS